MTTTFKQFECGCKFPVVNGHVEIPDDIPENCQRTWNLVSDGLTWGVFQLDSSTGQKYSEEAKPKSIDEMADVQSIIRPGTLGVKEQGKNLAQHYCDRKHKKDDVNPMHSSVEEILRDTQQIIVYQEQAILIAKKLAGFTGDQADLYIRKAIGKKNVKLINEAKKLFLEGCERVGIVNKEKALEIFQGIESAGRYSFNKSHAVAYSKDAYYYSAYIKAHFPRSFYCSEMQFSKDNDGIKDAINDAKKLSITVRKPCLAWFNSEPEIQSKDILFPLAKIKYVSEGVINQIEGAVQEFCEEKELHSPDSMRYRDWLIVLCGVKKDAVKALVLSGALDFLKIPRMRFWKDLEIFHKLTGKKQPLQLEYISKHSGTISDALVEMTGLGTGKETLISTKRMLPKIRDLAQLAKQNERVTQNEPYQMAEWEKYYLGIEITCTKLDAVLNSPNNAYECIDVYEKRCTDKGNISLNCIIDSWKNWENNEGKTHCFIKIYDQSCELDAVIFDKNYSEMNKSMIKEGNTIVAKGKRSGRSFLIESIREI